MRKIIKILFVLLFGSLSQANAELPQKLSLSFDFGYKGLTAELNDAWPVRQDVGSVSSYTNRNVNINAEMNFLGLSAEYALDNRFSLISGLRFITLDGDAIKNDYDRGGSFFLRLNSLGSQVEYTRIRKIREESGFIGIPIELKYTPLNFGFVSLYTKLSTEFAYRVSHLTDIEFKLTEMEAYEKSVLNDLNIKSNPFYSSIYITFGAKFKLSKSIYASLDLFTPAFYMTENNSSLLDISNISGTQFSLVFPLNK